MTKTTKTTKTTAQYRAMFLDSKSGDFHAATEPTTHASAEAEVARLTKAGFNAMVESVASSKRLAKRDATRTR